MYNIYINSIYKNSIFLRAHARARVYVYICIYLSFSLSQFTFVKAYE